MIQQHKHWRSKRVKTTLADRIGKDAARLWYTLSLQLQEADKRILDRQQETLYTVMFGGKYERWGNVPPHERIRFWGSYHRLQARINLRHCKIERLKRFLNNLR